MTTPLERRFRAYEIEYEKSHDQKMARALAARRLRSEGYTLRQIGKALGVSRETVRRDLYDTRDGTP
jgi:transposase